MAGTLSLVDSYLDNTLTTAYGGVDADWLELDDAHIFLFNLPGMRREDVRVQVVGGDMLQVSGERNAYLENSLAWGGGRGGQIGSGSNIVKWHVKERPSKGSFVRKFQLPPDVNVDDITAFDDKGVLVVTLHKRFPTRKPRYLRNIPISVL